MEHSTAFRSGELTLAGVVHTPEELEPGEKRAASVVVAAQLDRLGHAHGAVAAPVRARWETLRPAPVCRNRSFHVS